LTLMPSLELVVVDHPVAAQRLTELRTPETSPGAFRDAMRALSAIWVYEATRSLPTSTYDLHTGLGDAVGTKLSRSPLIVPVLRAGLGMLTPALDLLPDATVGFIGIARDEETFQPVPYVDKVPRELAGRPCLALDPMLATGGSLLHTCRVLAERGAGEPITIVCVLAAPEGVQRLEESGISLRVVTASVDSHLNDRAFIVPGLGDAGDRQFGPAS
jgi:uracil phosphoribosyltransferase